MADRLTVRSDRSDILVIQSAVGQQFIKGLCVDLCDLVGAVLHTEDFIRSGLTQGKQTFRAAYLSKAQNCGR